MAHELEVTADGASMAYVGQVPWHGLGQEIDPNSTPEEMGKAAGLDWTVSLHPTFCEFGDGEERKKVYAGRNALIRDTDGAVLTNVGERWTPVQNKDMLDYFNKFCKAGGATMETAGSLRGGRNVWALAKLNAGFKLPDGDETKGYLLFNNAHELGKATEVRVTSVRVVCANTIAMAMQGDSKSSYKQNHLSEFDFDKAADVVRMANERIVEQGHFAQKLLKVEFGREEVMEFMYSLISEEALSNADLELFDEDPGAMLPRMAGMMDSYANAPGAVEGNGWGVLNAVTHYVDHKANNTADGRLASAWFGAGAALKNKAVTKLSELV